MSLHIPLDNRFSISADHFQWILLKDERPFWFFSNLETLILDYLQLKIRESNVHDLHQLQHSLKTQTERIIQVLNNIPKARWECGE